MPMTMLSRFRQSPFAFPLAALTALMMFFISETSYREASLALGRLAEMGTIRMTIQTLRRSLTDAETGQRGYLLTGRPEYLEPYYSSLGAAGESLASLNAYYRDDPAAGPLVKAVSMAARDKLSELAETLKLYGARSEGNGPPWRELLLSNIGKEKMDAVRDGSEQLLRFESDKVTATRQGIFQTMWLGRIGVTAMSALSLLALYMYLRQTAALERQRKSQQELMSAERDNLEREVTARTEELTELAQHLQTVREDERGHLARELHDELGALLTAAKLDVARLKSRLGSQLAPEVTERLLHLNDALNSGIALKRRIIEDLHPSSLSNLGLTAAIDILTREFSERSEIEVHCSVEPVSLSSAGELTVYRMIQEALTNVSKYAQATQVEVELHPQGAEVRVAVRDNGVGFDIDKPRGSAHGLLGMRFRLGAEGGRLTLTSAPGHGTLIEAVLPASTGPDGGAAIHGARLLAAHAG